MNESIVSDILLNNISDNYIVNGTIVELCKNDNIYMIHVNNEDKKHTDYCNLVEIANISIKYLKQYCNNFSNKYINYYFRYNDTVCKFTIIECIDDTIKYELKLNIGHYKN